MLGSNKATKYSKYSTTTAGWCYRYSCCHGWYGASQCLPKEGPNEGSFVALGAAILVGATTEPNTPLAPSIVLLANAFVG